MSTCSDSRDNNKRNEGNTTTARDTIVNKRLPSNREVITLKKKINGKYGCCTTHVNNLKELELDSMRYIGFGTFSAIGRGYSRKLQEEVAVKIVNLRDKVNRAYLKKCLPHEVKLWRELSKENHVNILTLENDVRTSRFMYMITELVDCGNLHEYLMKTSVGERLGKTIFSQIVSAISHCHGNKIAHRDIKPANLLLGVNQCVKLADFSFATRSNPVSNHQQCGTQNMLSPEQCTRKSYNPFISDLWQTGLTLYMILFRKLPYRNHKKKHLMNEIRGLTNLHKNVPFPKYTVSLECKELIAGMLNVNTGLRMDVEEIMSASWLVTSPAVCE